MFEINGNKYSLEDLQQESAKYNMPFDEYLSAMKDKGLSQVVEQDNISWFDQTWFGRGIAAASTTGEATDLMSQNFSNIDMESIQEFMKAKESEAKSYAASDRMTKFQEQYVKEGKTWSAFFRGVKDQPGLLPELFVQSLGTQIGTAFDSPGASLGAVAAGAGTGAAVAGPLGALAGAMGGLATSMEAALTFGELIETRLKEKNQEFTDENIKALLEAEGAEIRNKAIGRGLTIGAIEGFSGGLAGKAGVAASKLAKGAKRAKVAAGAAGVGVEAAGGATGEVLGRVVAGQEMDAAEIGFEAITGTVTAPVNVSAALLTAKQPTYKLNGQTVTYEQMKNFVDTADDIDIAKADIQMQNDFTGIGKKAQAKQKAAEVAILKAGDIEVITEVKKAKDLNKIAATIELAKQGKQIANVKDSFVVENNEEATKAYEELQNQYGKDVIKDQDVTGADGFFVPTPDGNVIIINKEIAAQTGQINVGGHELLHGVVQKHYNSLSPEARAKFINDFKNTISKESLQYIQNIIDARNKAGEDIKTDSDEYLTIYSDGIVKEQITYNEGIFTKFKNFLQNIFRKFGYNKEFGSGLDTYNFMRDYNKNIKEFNKISQRALDIAGSEAVVGEVSFSKEASDKVQSIYEEKGVGGAVDIINEFKPIVGKIVDKRKDAPNFDRQLLTDEIETGQRGILDLISEYKPDSGVPLAAYINKFLPARAIEASRRVLGEEFTTDITEAKTVAAEETTEVEVKAKPVKKKIVLADRLKVKSKVNESVKKQLPKLDVKNLTFKKLKNLVPDITGEMFGISPRKLKTLANITKKELQAAQMFINKNADLLIAMLPEGSTQSGTATGVPNSLLKAFYTKTDRAKMAKTGSASGLPMQVKNKINRKEFLEVFGIVNGKPDRTDRNTSARVLSLANLTGKMMSNQAVRENLQLLGDSKQTIQNIREGASEVMFSRSKNIVFQKHGLPDLKINDPKDGFKNFDIFVDKMILLATYGKPGLIRAVDLRGNITNSAVKDYARSTTLYEELGVFTIGKSKDRVYLRPDAEGALGKSVKSITKAKAKRYNEISKANFDDMIDMIKKAIKANPNDKELHSAIFEYLSSAVNDTSHPMRAGAEYVGGDITATGKIIYEHALQNANVRDVIMDALLDKKQDFNKTLKAIRKNYKLIALSEADAKAVDAATYIDENGNLIKYKNGMGVGWDIFTDNWFDRYFNSDVNIVNPNNLRLIKNNKTFTQEYKVTKSGKVEVTKNINKVKVLDKAIKMSRSIKDPKGITILDFDDTLATTKSLVRYTAPNGETGTLNAEEYASTYQELLNQGYKFDFSEFNKVVKGKIAPLFQKALKLQGKFGPKNMFVLTARPPEAAQAIFDFLKANGLNIPLKNITGLANSTAEAKALWIADKVGEGFNDFYFADDALQNVQAVDNMLEQFDVKRKVQQAKIKFSKTRNETFNDILEEVTGIESKKRFARTKARKRGASKGKFRFFIPPSHEDFVGLLYNFLGKGKRGDTHRDFFEKALVRPLNRANRELDAARQAIANDYKALNKQFPEIKKMLTKKTPDGDFTYTDAIRIYLWNKHDYKIPGLSPVDQKNLVELVNSNPDLKSYAEAINTISKQETYVDPTDGWESGDLRMDLDDATGRVGREQFFAEFNEAADEIFSEENLNKIEAGYGNGVREALEDMLYRIKTGKNRAAGTNRLVNNFMNFVNGAVGGVMFFNIRSATLQQMSLVNYINFADNNIFAAAKAFANQKQYWADFAFIFNSDMLKQRRGGIQTDVNGAELAETISKSKYPIRTLIRKLLQLGFLPTQIGDNMAIATGGSTYYRNRINKYLREGLSQKEAENKAFDDFQEITQKTQQSARPDMLSQQQVSPLGRPILAFQNITSQFNRLGKKAAQDMYNRRITPPNTTLLQSDISNASRILYYFAVQNLVFYSLQTALFAAMFDDDEEDTEFFTKKRERLINGSIDSVLRGSGIHGAIFATLKNMAIKFAEQRGKTFNPDESAVMMEMFNLSPPLGIKARRIANAEKTLFYNRKVIDEMNFFDIDNPQWSAYTNYVQGVTNLPVNRLYNKVQNLRQALNSENQAYQRLLMFLGWSQYNLGIKNEKIEKIKESTKLKSKSKTKTTKTDFIF
jgi:hypothetical protein